MKWRKKSEATRFQMKIVERLGLKPEEVALHEVTVTVDGDEEMARVNLTAYLPKDEVLQYFMEFKAEEAR